MNGTIPSHADGRRNVLWIFATIALNALLVVVGCAGYITWILHVINENSQRPREPLTTDDLSLIGRGRFSDASITPTKSRTVEIGMDSNRIFGAIYLSEDDGGGYLPRCPRLRPLARNPAC